MSGATPFNPSGQQKGRKPEGCGQKENVMNTVVQMEPVGKVHQPETAGFHTQSANRKLGIWLDSLVEKAKEKPVVQMVKLTPELALLLLDRNPSNRKLTESLVENYTHEIAGGRWAFNGEPIIVSNTGELNDGQHRCHGVIGAQKAIDVLMVVGVERGTRTTLDQGKARTVGDYLTMEGRSYANVLGAVAGYVWQFRNRGMLASGSRTRATKGEVMETVSQNKGLERSVATVHVKGADAAGGKSVLAFAHFILGSINRDDADYFVHALITGAGLKAGDPVLYVRNRLINERGRLRANEKAELIFKGWNAWRRGDRISRLLLTGGTLPVLES